MSNFVTAKEMSEKWNISRRRISTLCIEGRIEGAERLGNMWTIPKTAKKPIDKRTIRYEKKEAELKPFVKWAGGKRQLVSELEKYFISSKGIKRYVEAFVGGGALLFHILQNYDIEEIYISDINKELINAYNVIKNNVGVLIDRLNEIQSQFLALYESERKSYYYEKRTEYNTILLNDNTAVEKASLFIFLNKTCFNGLYRVNKKGEFNVPMGDYKKPVILEEENLLNISKALQKVTIICGDYSLVKEYIDDETFVYFDPPYRPISQTSSFTSYNADCFDDKEQQRLASFINEIDSKGAKFLLSNSDPQNINIEDNFFEDLYRKYIIDKVLMSRMINSKASGRGKINELLISNQ